jgi:DNA-binding NtrC family response regulator
VLFRRDVAKRIDGSSSRGSAVSVALGPQAADCLIGRDLLHNPLTLAYSQIRELRSSTPDMSRVLIIDDDPAIAQVISEICVEIGHEPVVYNGAEKLVGALASCAPNLVLTDIHMRGTGGMAVLRACKTEIPSVPVVIITADKQLQTGVEAIKAGARDYLTKPFKIDELRSAIQRALCKEGLPADSNRVEPRRKTQFENIVGDSARMQSIFGLIAKVADTESTILILGESGTGKELVAKALHYQSERREYPFVAINCSALPASLLESELFGHKKGAFTGAVQDKVGLFEEAEGGTIFLDEIGSMELPLQTKLLRVLQERVVRRVGDNRSVPIRVRVLAASNEPLFEKTRTGTFREDLFYRLAVIPVEMPPLRERTDDIPLLVKHFLDRNAAQSRKVQAFRIEEDALQLVCQYRWPGNVRELENAIERACALCDDGVLAVKDLPPQVRAESGAHGERNFSVPVGYTLSHFTALQEKLYIQETIRFTGGTREAAARILGISPATLYRKLDAKASGGGKYKPIKPTKPPHPAGENPFPAATYSSGPRRPS